MSQATPPLPKPGDADLRAVVNTVFSSIATASGSITGDNIAEEGLDEFIIQRMSDVLPGYTADTRTKNTNGATFATMDITGLLAMTPGFTVGIDQLAIVRAEFQLLNDPAGGTLGAPLASIVTARLRQSISGTPAVIVGTTMDGTAYGTGVFVMDAVLGPGVYDFVEIQTKCDPAADYFVGYGSIIIELLYRTTV